MTVEARTARIDTQDEPAFKPNYVGTKVEALNNRSGLGLTGLRNMATADWDALKLELHQKIQELKQSGDGYWQRVKPDLETKVAALEESIRLSSPCSENIRRGLGSQQRNKPDRSSEQTELKREHSGLKKAQAKLLPNLAA
jgi:hypothetical protein